MKLTLETYKKKYSVETEYDDINIIEYYEMFGNMLIQAGFHPNTIEGAIIELYDDIKDEKEL